MASSKAATIPEDIKIYALDYPDFCIYNPVFSSKDGFLHIINTVTKACPRMAIIWREILLEPLGLGYISWNSMVRLMIATHQHDTNPHPCTSLDQAHLLIKMSLLLSRTIQYPPFPGGDDSKSHFYAVTRTTVPAAYDHFETFIFKDIDSMMERRSFQTIRKQPDSVSNGNDIIYYGLQVYHIMKELQILPPALVDPHNVVPSYKPPLPLR